MLGQTLEQVARLRAEGVEFVTGTDAGWRHTTFDAMPNEIRLLTETGMTVVEAIHAATGKAADVLGIGGEVGRIQPGQIADLVVANGDLTQSIRALGDLSLVMQAGNPVVQKAATGL